MEKGFNNSIFDCLILLLFNVSFLVAQTSFIQPGSMTNFSSKYNSRRGDNKEKFNNILAGVLAGIYGAIL